MPGTPEKESSACDVAAAAAGPRRCVRASPLSVEPRARWARVRPAGARLRVKARNARCLPVCRITGSDPPFPTYSVCFPPNANSFTCELG